MAEHRKVIPEEDDVLYSPDPGEVDRVPGMCHSDIHTLECLPGL